MIVVHPFTFQMTAGAHAPRQVGGLSSTQACFLKRPAHCRELLQSLREVQYGVCNRVSAHVQPSGTVCAEEGFVPALPLMSSGLTEDK